MNALRKIFDTTKTQVKRVDGSVDVLCALMSQEPYSTSRKREIFETFKPILKIETFQEIQKLMKIMDDTEENRKVFAYCLKLFTDDGRSLLVQDILQILPDYFGRWAMIQTLPSLPPLRLTDILALAGQDNDDILRHLLRQVKFIVPDEDDQKAMNEISERLLEADDETLIAYSFARYGKSPQMIDAAIDFRKEQIKKVRRFISDHSDSDRNFHIEYTRNGKRMTEKDKEIVRLVESARRLQLFSSSSESGFNDTQTLDWSNRKD